MNTGDLHLSEIAACFHAFKRIYTLALEGLSQVEIAEELEWRCEDVRQAARLMGFDVSPLIRHQAICPKCGHMMRADGHCDVCILRLRLERLYAVNAVEHEREVERLENRIDAIKQDTSRVRRKLGTNPRKR